MQMIVGKYWHENQKAARKKIPTDVPQKCQVAKSNTPKAGKPCGRPKRSPSKYFKKTLKY